MSLYTTQTNDDYCRQVYNSEYMQYTHNLKILLFGSSGELVQDDASLNKVKDIFCEKNGVEIEVNGKMETITIKWDKTCLDLMRKNFMGDLFTRFEETDTILLKHVRSIGGRLKLRPGDDIDSYYKITFCLTRIVCEM